MGEATEHARVLATHAFEHLPAIVGRDADGPLAPGLLLDRMGLIDHPMPDGRQYFAIRGNISEQQRVVRHHDIGAGSANACPVYQAFMGEERAKLRAHSREPVVRSCLFTLFQRMPSASRSPEGLWHTYA